MIKKIFFIFMLSCFACLGVSRVYACLPDWEICESDGGCCSGNCDNNWNYCVPSPTSTPSPCSSNGVICDIDSNCCSNYCADGWCANLPVNSPTPTAVPCDEDGNGECNTPDPYCIYECEAACDAGQIYKEKIIYCYTHLDCDACSIQRNVPAQTQCGSCYTTPVPTGCQPYACFNVPPVSSYCPNFDPSGSPCYGSGNCDNCGGVDCGWCGGEEPPSGPTPTPGCTENCMSDPRYLTTCYNDTFGICANSRWCYGQLEPIAQTAEDELSSRIGSYEQATGYEAYLDTDVAAVRDKLEQAQDRKDTITVLVVEPLKEPYLKEISPGLSAMQEEVNGLIAAAYPFDDPVALICNDEGKINGMELNRSLRDDRGQLYDIVAGPFLVAGLGEDDFTSLSPEMAEKYMEHFKMPEMFAKINGEITAIPVPAEVITPDNFLTGEKVKTPRGSFSLTNMSKEQMEAAGYGFHHSSDDGRFHIMGNGTRAFAIVNEEARTYDIYQLKDFSGRRDYAFEPLDRLRGMERKVDMQNYDKVYSGAMFPGENLESIYTRFNVDRPEDFKGHSLSVSDVVVIRQNGQETAHYCDSFGFAEVPEFLQPENYLKNAEMAMEDDYGMVDGIINNGRKEVTPPGTDEKTSIRDRLAEAKRECAERKPPETKKPEKNSPEHDL